MNHPSILLSVLALILPGCKDDRQAASDKAPAPASAAVTFEDRLTGKIFQNYLHLKLALVESDPKAARTAAGNLAESLTGERADIRSVAEELAREGDLERQRAAFTGSRA
jgi:hypothetical protein